jgi:hypothetical protein
MKTLLKIGLSIGTLALFAVLSVSAYVSQADYAGLPITGASTNGSATNATAHIDTVQDGGTLSRMVFTTSVGIQTAAVYFINVDDSSVLYSTNLCSGPTGTNTAIKVAVTTNLLHGAFTMLASNVTTTTASNTAVRYISAAGVTTTSVNIKINVLDIK